MDGLSAAWLALSGYELVLQLWCWCDALWVQIGGIGVFLKPQFCQCWLWTMGVGGIMYSTARVDPSALGRFDLSKAWVRMTVDDKNKRLVWCLRQVNLGCFRRHQVLLSECHHLNILFYRSWSLSTQLNSVRRRYLKMHCCIWFDPILLKVRDIVLQVATLCDYNCTQRCGVIILIVLDLTLLQGIGWDSATFTASLEDLNGFYIIAKNVCSDSGKPKHGWWPAGFALMKDCWSNYPLGPSTVPQ
jgi:hypothetical protein